MWALSYRNLFSYLKSRIDITKVERYDIPEGGFLAYTKDGEKSFPFEEIKAMRLSTCDLCYDFTAELSDISVGSTEVEEDWNTVIVRTEKGEAIFEAARKEGVLESKPFKEERMKVLREASANKKKRTLSLLKERFGATDGAPMGYLKLNEKERGYFQ